MSIISKISGYVARKCLPSVLNKQPKSTFANALGLALRNPKTHYTSEVYGNPELLNIIRHTSSQVKRSTYNTKTGKLTNVTHYPTGDNGYVEANGNGRFLIQDYISNNKNVFQVKFNDFKSMLSYFRKELPIVSRNATV